MSNVASGLRKPDMILEEIRELDRATAGATEWLRDNPTDQLLSSFLITQDAARREHLEAELMESYAQYRKHSLVYAVKQAASLEVVELSRLLKGLRGALDATMTHILREKQSVPLYFDGILQSSYGILLSTEFDEELLCSQYERTFEFMFNVLGNLSDSHHVDDGALLELFEQDKPLLRKYRSFYRSISDIGQPVEIRWNGILASHRDSASIEGSAATDVYRRLANADHPDTEDVTVRCSIQGVSLLDHTVQVVPFQRRGVRLKLTFGHELVEQLKPLLGEAATITYRVISEYDEEKDRVTTTKALLSLQLDSEGEHLGR